MKTNTKKTIFNILRWLARISTLLIVLLLLVMFIGEAWGNLGPIHFTLEESLEMAATLVMAAGALLAWRMERLGGWLCFGGGFVFVLVESVASGKLDLVWFPMVFLIGGVLYLLSGYISPRGLSAA